MSTRGLKKMALLLLIWVAMQECRLKAQSIVGNTVTNNLIVTGSNVYMGSQTGTTNPGWGTVYIDSTNSTVDFQATRGGNTWEWVQNDGAILQMTLDNTNTVKLYNSSGTSEITLNPTGASTFAGSVTISGTNNTMPGQTLSGSSSVLTEGLADSRYVSSSNITIGSGTNYLGDVEPTMALFGGTATGPFSFAEGPWSTASGPYSVAIMASTATGWNSTALGNSTASGALATAVGKSTASGWYATSMGRFSDAGGYGSTAMGQGANAGNSFSTAMGYYTSASGYSSTAVGYYSSASGNLATAMGNANAIGNYATAMGNSTAIGVASTAMGVSSSASGNYSTAMGNSTAAIGISATAMGSGSSARGNFSTANGFFTTAQAYNSFVIGTYNIGLNSSGGTASATYWVATDPLFEVGNGTSTTNSDAFIVYKNGNAGLQGGLSTGRTITAPDVVTTTQVGDIPMFTGN